LLKLITNIGQHIGLIIRFSCRVKAHYFSKLFKQSLLLFCFLSTTVLMCA